ncbi:MAG TPA: response regulator, partial [bacterium]|nr:response regulator [bacterium]
MNILLVDDSAITLDLLSMILLDKGHRVRTAPDGAKACVLLREEPAHIVLTDWMMPVMDGPALCRWIR